MATFLLMAPALLTGRAIFWGTPILQFVPWRAWAWQTLLEGHLPLWNPLVGMGAPLMANYQSALFYPPNWLLFILYLLGGTSLMAWGQGLLIWFHLAWAGLGMTYLARRLNLSILAQTVGGLALGLSGYLIGRASFLSINAAVAWLPWILALTSDDFFSRMNSRNTGEKRSFRFPILLTLALSMQFLAGHAQTTWYTLMLAAVWAIFWGWRAYRWREVVQSLGKLMLAALCAVALSAVQLLPTAEYLIQSQRGAGVAFENAMTYSFSPLRLITLLAPDFFGNPGYGDFWGYANYWEDAIYIGLLPLIMAFIAVFALRKKRIVDNDQITRPIDRPFIVFLISLALVAFILALGSNTPIFPWLYRNIPTFSLFQAPTRFTIMVVFALALLAGFGIELWKHPTGRALYWTRLATAGAFAMIMAVLLAWSLGLAIKPTFLRATALAGIWGAGVGLLTLLSPSENSTPVLHRRWVYGVCGLLCVDLIFSNLMLNPVADTSLYQPDIPATTQVKQLAGGHRLYLGAQDEYDLKFYRFFRFNTYYPGESWGNLQKILLPDLNIPALLPSANNFDPILPGRYTRWMDNLKQVDPQTTDRLLAMMDVGVVERIDKSSPTGVRFTKVAGLDRVRWVACASPAKDAEDALKQVMEKTTRSSVPLNWVILEGMSSSQNQKCDEKAIGISKIIAEQPNQLTIQVSADTSGWLVLADIWYPGWVAEVDGVRVPILVADYLFRSILLTGGTHKIVFRYVPLSFYLGLTISSISWILIGFAYGLKIRQIRSRSTKPYA